MLKRHLMTAYSMTPEQYRAKWGLAHDYPMVAPSYAAKRREPAKAIGLGRKPAPAPTPEPKSKRGKQCLERHRGPLLGAAIGLPFGVVG